MEKVASGGRRGREGSVRNKASGGRDGSQARAKRYAENCARAPEGIDESAELRNLVLS